jgi:hypothetical protein
MSGTIDTDITALTKILKANPEMWWGSPGSSRHSQKSLIELRAETVGDFGLAQFRRARAFLAVAPRTLRPNRCCSTYSWKHIAERWHRKSISQYHDYYVGEGAFVAACIADGVAVSISERCSYAALSRRAMDMGSGRV